MGEALRAMASIRQESVNVSHPHHLEDHTPVSTYAFICTHTEAALCGSQLPCSLTIGLRIPVHQALAQGPHLMPPLLAPGACGAYFRCRNGRCVPPSLVCDRWGVDNCGDGSDQASWPPANCRGQ